MLESLTIRQVALIDEVTIRFHRGMQVLTGETGAGKSIVVDSVNLILGGRADRDLIRSGSDKATVEAVFNTAGNPGVKAFMEQENIEYDGETVTVFREISAGGRNLCRVCGVLIPVSRLKDLAVHLMDLHGQSEHQFLADPERHMAFLDQTGDVKHTELLEQVRKDYGQFIGNHRAYAKLVKQNENRESHMLSLERDLEELKKAAVRPGEAAELAERRKQLEKAEKESESYRSVSELLSGTDGKGGLPDVKQAVSELKALAQRDESVREISARCETLYYELEDIAYRISMKCSETEYDPAELEKTDSRLDRIHRLERKFGTDADSLSGMLEKTESEYRLLAGLESEIGRMSAEHKKLLAAYRNTARELTESRKRLASAFEEKMTGELYQLGMENTRFRVEFKQNDTGRPTMPTPDGDDRIEFLISPNPGEPLKPLARIASGGELSRLMLAVKTLESSRSGTDAMVFDEIDTGISGRMAQAVAEKMVAISADRQVICVTHLPQIAAAADYHYLVRKSVADGRTHTSVGELDLQGRTGELSRMISGADGVTQESDAYAASMLQAAAELRHKSSIAAGADCLNKSETN
ncbi:MAG: DNA repair protein RecN [Clostridiales bacterium]|nr:DNA repair protein RecN [Clostridiales bacterium]